MSKDLSYVLVTPYTVAKSRTGGVLSRLLSRTNLELVGAQMILPNKTFAMQYAQKLRNRSPQNQIMLLADYVEQSIASSAGRSNRSLLLLFQGENPCEKLLTACGHLYSQHIDVDTLSGETIRDTYADMIFSPSNPDEVKYFEPAVLTPRNQEEADEDLRLISDILESKENIAGNTNRPDSSAIEKTLVIIKPDNWLHRSSRPGTIIDMFSRTGLRITSMKVHHFSLAEALEFYGPVEAILKEKLAPRFGLRAKELLEEEFGLSLSEESLKFLTESFGMEYAKDQFFQIVNFMCGKRPDNCLPEELDEPGEIKCMILVYEGENAVNKIRNVLGSTNPSEASDGTVRREFGSNVMVNTAHASDSVESFLRERAIVKTDENSLGEIIRQHLKRIG